MDDLLKDFLNFLRPDSIFDLWPLGPLAWRGGRRIYRRIRPGSEILETPGAPEIVLAAAAIATVFIYRRVSKQMQARATGVPSLRRSVGRRLQAQATGTPDLKFQVLGRDGRPQSNR